MCVCVCSFLSVSSETLGGVVSVCFSKLFLFCGLYEEKSLEPSRGSCLRGRSKHKVSYKPYSDQQVPRCDPHSQGQSLPLHLYCKCVCVYMHISCFFVCVFPVCVCECVNPLYLI